MKIAKKGGKGYRETNPEEEEGRNANLVSLSGAKGGVEVLTTDETEANKIHLRILDLKARYEDTQFELAELLYRVSQERLFTAKSLGAYERFDDYVETELGFTVRKAQMLAAIHWWYWIKQKADLRLLSGAKAIGWTKAHHLVKVVDVKNADEWFERAKSMTAKELQRQVRAALKAAGKKQDRRIEESKPRMNPPPGMEPEDPGLGAMDEPEASEPEPEPEPEPDGVAPPSEEEVDEMKSKDDEWTTFSMRVPKETKPSILQAIEVAKGMAETHHDGYALSLMAQHFLSFADDKRTVMVGQWLKAFERNTGLKVIAVSEDEQQVVYGHKHLQGVQTTDEGEEGVNAHEA